MERIEWDKSIIIICTGGIVELCEGPETWLKITDILMRILWIRITCIKYYILIEWVEKRNIIQLGRGWLRWANHKNETKTHNTVQ